MRELQFKLLSLYDLALLRLFWSLLSFASHILAGSFSFAAIRKQARKVWFESSHEPELRKF